MPSPPTALRPARLSARDWSLVSEAGLALTAASLAIAVVPFRRIAHWLSCSSIGDTPRDETTAALRARWAIEACAWRLPWKTVCFQKGLALHWMLRRRGVDSRLHYGVAQNAGLGLRAHVWVSLGGEIVMGGDGADQFACLAVFPADGARAKPRNRPCCIRSASLPSTSCVRRAHWGGVRWS